MFNFLNKNKIIPEALLAYKWRFPDKIEVSLKSSEDGGYVAFINNLPGCITQAQNGEELFEMVNNALYTYLEIPHQYHLYMPAFLPPEDVREQLNMGIPEKYLNNVFVLQKT